MEAFLTQLPVFYIQMMYGVYSQAQPILESVYIQKTKHNKDWTAINYETKIYTIDFYLFSLTVF